METDQLAQLIDGKRDVLLQLHALVRRQFSQSASQEPSGLLTLLAAKQQLIDRLQNLEAELDPFRQQDPDTRQWRSAADRQRCATQAQECNRLLAEVIELERGSLSALQTRQQETTEKLQFVGNAAAAATAYSASATQSTTFDLASES